MKNSWIIIVYMFAWGCSEETVEYDSFFGRTDQQVAERIISDELEAIEKVNLSEHQIYQPGNMAANSTHLFLVDFGGQNVVKISKSDVSDIEIWEIIQGEGPGEAQLIRAVGASDERVYIGDSRGVRLIEKDITGNHVRDIALAFSPENFVINESGWLINQSSVMQDSLFMLYHPASDSLYGFGEGQIDIEESIKYSGYLTTRENHIFYGGYAEPLLRKYTVEGGLLFSRSTIDNFDTRNNYQDYSTENFRAFGFAEDASYSTYRLGVSDDELFIVPFHNGDENVRYIDRYDAGTGDYIASILMDQFPRELVVDEEFIYTISMENEEDLIINRYRKPE